MERRRIVMALIGICLGLVVTAVVLSIWDGQPLGLGSPANEGDIDEAGKSKLIYLREVDGRINLWLDQGSPGPIALTDEPIGVWDYSVTPDGRRILLSSMAADGSDDIILVEVDSLRRSVLVDCQGTACRQPRWQPDGKLVAYEAHPLNGEPISVWLLDTEDGRLQPVLTADLQNQVGIQDRFSRHPRWSSDGRYLSFYLPDARVITVLAIDETESPVLIPANLDLMGDWSPDGPSLAYTELTFGESEAHAHEDIGGNVISHAESALYSHVVVTDLPTGQTEDISEGFEVDDGLPAWQPQGYGLVAGRTDMGAGRQLWYYTIETASWQPLSQELFFHHTAPAWSPDGRYVAYMRHPVNGESEPSIWLFDVELAEVQEIMEGAFLPGWLD